MARVRNAISSFRLEGEVVELDRARKLLEGSPPDNASEGGILRLAQAYSRLTTGRLPSLTVDSICSLHRELYDGVLEPSGHVGVLKSRQNYIVDSASEVLRFTPTPPERTAAELDALFEWYRDHRFSYAPPVVAAIFFAEFQAIHPFMDGNGRLGRLLNIALLVDMGCIRAPLIPLGTRLFRTSDNYYELLGTTNEGGDYTPWVRYFVKQTHSAYRAAHRQANLAPVVSRFSRESTRGLLTWVLSGDGSWFSRGDYPNPKHYSQPALSSALGELTRAGYLEPQGERRGRRYRLRSKFLAEIYRAKF